MPFLQVGPRTNLVPGIEVGLCANVIVERTQSDTSDVNGWGPSLNYSPFVLV